MTRAEWNRLTEFEQNGLLGYLEPDREPAQWHARLALHRHVSWFSRRSAQTWLDLIEARRAGGCPSYPVRYPV